ncbi:MAG: pilin [bacterium]|nr:pilin [bacterium]
MKQRMLTKIFAISLVLGLGMLVLPSPSLVYGIDEPARNAACEGIGAIGGDCQQGDSGIRGLVGSVINILSWIVGIAAVIMVIVGGLKYVLSSGDANGITSAKNTILYAVIGLVVASLAQVLVRYVIVGSVKS